MLRDYKISIIRILATISIVLCHLFQSQNMQIAFWLNVGVQIFLFMSGYLYGNKDITNTKEWIKKQFRKILIPYYIYINFILIIYFLFAKTALNWKNILSFILNLQLLVAMPKGLGHLWFIPVILIAYLITPLLQKIVRSKKYSKIIKIFLLSSICIILQLFFLQGRINTGVCNLICYIVGYIMATINNKKHRNIIIYIILPLAVISNFLKILLQYQIHNNIIVRFLIYNSHILLGISIFIILYMILKNINKILSEKSKKYIDIIDRSCYYIYITHHTLILGPISLISLTPIFLINLLIILICIIISVYLLKKASNILLKGECKE